MMLRWLLASLHLLALPLGLGAIVVRSRALRVTRTVADLPRVFASDTLWGLAAILWISTGLARAFGGFEKGTDYYLNDRVFSLKMGLLVLILLLEVWPMVALIRWRIGTRRGAPVDLSSAGTLARISAAQAVVTVLMVFAATALARGLFY
jgi:putative membrane protein